ncbi:MAG: NAD-dependent epimerase/dehydratase family protein [Chloroflexi bacterium]|nr:NAD-dependent epimerase/dehydratase family protein [Chloroflexota bacterium]
MASELVLVTGGAGFIGSHLVDALIARGHRVRVLDNLEPQVHGEGGVRPDYLNPQVEYLWGDVRDRDTLRHALDGVEVVFHEAAMVGVGQSMYQIARYVSVNTLGTATLLDLLAAERGRVRKLIVASSMSIYGEGGYTCSTHGPITPPLRAAEQLARRDWEMRCPHCGAQASPTPTGEDKTLSANSIYAIAKKDQEEMCLCVGRAYGIPAVALRYFNTYGTRQALSNPYTGVAAIFSSRLLNGRAPQIFEDGLQTRDFVHVSDIVQANLLAMEHDAADYQSFNVGTGRSITIRAVAETVAAALGVEIAPEIVGKYREGDIRHCVADISRARELLGYAPRVTLEHGMRELAGWVRGQTAVDGSALAARELERRGLAR